VVFTLAPRVHDGVCVLCAGLRVHGVRRAVRVSVAQARLHNLPAMSSLPLQMAVYFNLFFSIVYFFMLLGVHVHKVCRGLARGLLSPLM
jgi:hypothetical protein